MINKAVASEVKHQTEKELIGLNELPVIDRWSLERRSRALAQAVYLGGDVGLCRVLGRYKAFVDTTDVGFAAHLLLDGFWESWLTVFIARRIRSDARVVDVGANHGYYTLLMADLAGPEGCVAAVEPNPAICSLLSRSLSVNGFSERVRLLQQAATDQDGVTLALCVPDHEPKNGYVLPIASSSAQAGTVLPVAGGRLDTALADWDRVDFIKIDVEGAEEAAVGGLTTILERDRPDVVLEFNARRCAHPAALIERLQALYGVIQVVDFDSEAKPATAAQLLDAGHPEDWLLFLSIH